MFRICFAIAIGIAGLKSWVAQKEKGRPPKRKRP